MKEKSKIYARETARVKFKNATSFLRGRAEMSLETGRVGSLIFFKLCMKAMREPFTQADVECLRRELEKCGFEDIRIPELTEASSTILCMANFPCDGDTTISDVVAFVTRNKKDFPDGLSTRIVVDDFAGNETFRALNLSADRGNVEVLF